MAARLAVLTVPLAAAIALGIARLEGWIAVIPRWLALAFVIVPAVYLFLALASVCLNLLTRRRWNEDNIFDRLADVFTYLPWP